MTRLAAHCWRWSELLWDLLEYAGVLGSRGIVHLSDKALLRWAGKLIDAEILLSKDW